MTGKKSQRQDQYNRGKQLFIDTAKDLFKSQGYDKTKVADIVNASGRNVSTLYHYFPEGKKDIVKILLITDIKDEFDKLAKLMTDKSDGSLIDSLHLFYHQFVEIFYRNWYLMSIMLYYKDDFEADVTPITREGTDHMRELLAAFLQQRVNNRELYITDCEVAAKLFFAPGMENIIVNFSEPEKDVFETSEIDQLIATWQRETIFFDSTN
ncbi:TetR family transcriptional regulator [Secundilactobacillus silagincola]|uniref:TetR family transcriptional regulator n=1 Tax=Secundilactobacillus silagincola TaxID=1714681 RepID=A0A1Z5J0D3_9LACO|nr:TetR/AcrR family transcriptional regulator [Secundilactobacillus silagincola]GAX07495.1 TetR family transcriptional regulator [Secundilactobacillus silagincola]